jgi:hypothetical protein
MTGRVYFLGAGATKAAAQRAPLSDDLVRGAREHFADEWRALGLEEFLRRLYKGRADVPVDNRIWNLFDYVIQQGKAASADYSLDTILELKTGILRLVIKELEQSLRQPQQGVFQQFVDAIKGGACVITTNYDVVLDRQLAQINSFNYGARLRYPVRANPRGGQLGQGAPEKLNAGPVECLKLHGSLNWLLCSKCDEVDLLPPADIRHVIEQPVYCANPACTHRYELLFITPTMFKSYENRFIRSVWDLAEERLVRARELVFVGYSMKDDDYQIQCLLMKALLRKDRPYDRVTVVEHPDSPRLKELEQKYRTLFDPIVFQPIGFEQYVRELARSC